jgi:hypothetical protein
LDLDDNNRFWWEVLETRALGALAGEGIGERMTIQLPEITAAVPRMRAFHFCHSSSSCSAASSSSSPPPLPRPASDTPGTVPHPFAKLERYTRLRWQRDSTGDAVQARLEFYSPKEHAGRDLEERVGNLRGEEMEKMRDMFRGILME